MESLYSMSELLTGLLEDTKTRFDFIYSEIKDKDLVDYYGDDLSDLCLFLQDMKDDILQRPIGDKK